MADGRQRNLDHRLWRDLLAGGPSAIRSDADLIHQFVAGHDEAAEAAFGVLVERHGPMVLGVCRRIVRDEHAAEDVFQAVFLILARKVQSVQVEDSLGRWLHGVTRRVALRARDTAHREVPAMAASHGQPADPAVEAVRVEARHLVAEEVERLPRKYREVVHLFHLDGLGHDQVAEALGVPVGTVRSRLSRARDLLRVRLTRQGIVPSVLTAWLGRLPAPIRLPVPLLQTTLRNLRGAAVAATSPAVLALTHDAMRSFLMTKVIGITALAATLGSLATGMAVLAGGHGQEAPPSTASASRPVATPTETPAAVLAPSASLNDQLRRIIAEFDDARDQAIQAGAKASNQPERWKIMADLDPQLAPYTRRIVDLAVTHPKEPAACDALIWVIHQPRYSDGGDYGDDFARAARLLVALHADNPEVARAGLGLENVLSERRDVFLEGIYANARNRESQGLIRLARAGYLVKQAGFIASARRFPERNVVHYQGYDDQGKLVEKTDTGSNEDEGYRVHLRMLDPDFVRREGERLYEEVIAQYGDIPYITTSDRDMERQARQTPSASIADPRKKQQMIATEKYLAETKRPTLGQVAADQLDDLRNLAVGKVAPDFEGTGANGKPIRLSAYRGQVVAVNYWFSTCGPCLEAIPHEKELAARMQGRPFTWLGVVTDGRSDDARKILNAEGITWPNILAGGDRIAAQYHVQTNPSYCVIDAAGVIRSRGAISRSSLDKLVERLVAEAEAKPVGSGERR